MSEQEAILLRNRMIGVLLRDARLWAGRTRRECAEVLGVSPATLSAYEEGRKAISLPELEVLARFLHVSPHHFLDADPSLLSDERATLPAEFIPLRHRVIGALLRQAREEAGRTQKELAELLGCSPRRISSYEYGEKPIPVAELEVLARALDRRLEYFFDEESNPVGRELAAEERCRAFLELPREVQEFVIKPVNRQYLEIAMRLADMPAAALRTIAEGLLEITY